MNKSSNTAFASNTVALDEACELARRRRIPAETVVAAVITERLPLGGLAFRVPAAVTNAWAGRSGR